MVKKLDAEALYLCCDPGILNFETTEDIKPSTGTIGQDRAVRAIDFGLSLQSKGFNIYVLGDSGTGRMTSIRKMLQTRARDEPVPDDWCYVYNFKDPDVPRAVSLPPGTGMIFQRDLDELINILKIEIPKVFESREYEKSKSKIMEEFQQAQKERFSALEEESGKKAFSIRKTVSGLVVVPVKKDGEPLNEEEFDALDDETRQEVEKIGKELQDKLDDIVREVRAREKDLKKNLSELEREAVLSAVDHLIDELKSKYRDYPKINTFLKDVKEDVLENIEDFKSQDEQQQSPLPFMKPPKAEPAFNRYSVNVFVNNSECQGAPVVFESNPVYFNLFGRVEHKFQYGVALTDFTMIKPGSIQRANGGYLVIEALDLLRNMFSYEAIKRAIRNREAKIEDVWEQYRPVSSTTLKPEAIPLDIKIILVGNPRIYYLLYNLDDEYRELFKVKADFDNTMPREKENILRYADFIASKSQEEGLRPFDKGGVARIIEHGMRLSGHREKLSSRFSEVADLMREADHYAMQDQKAIITAEHIETAISERDYRNSRIEDRMRELMIEDTIIVPTSGEVTGQVNGLAVLDLGDYSFGKPSRITARTYAGKAGVINIERETKMSGKIHEKAILIIAHYMGSRYALRKPLSLTAAITFEQLYGMIEGDSATCAELYALLSSLSGVPIKQNYAVTGSMDQNGDVQPIGGVNEKIEGFFSLCKERGLDGTQGVIIPERNLKHIMLKKEVVDAVRENRFSIHTINTIGEGMEILTGMPFGEQDAEGSYPEGTINNLVMKRLDEFTEALRPKKDQRKKEAKKENNGDDDNDDDDDKEDNGDENSVDK